MGILCLDPRRVAITGKVRAFALDKTGTLTQAWLDFLAVQPAQARPTTSSPHSGESLLTYERASCLVPTASLYMPGLRSMTRTVLHYTH